jgi:hypothetical protein
MTFQVSSKNLAGFPEIFRGVIPRRDVGNKKAKPPGARFVICLPLANIKRLSEDFVAAEYSKSMFYTK